MKGRAAPAARRAQAISLLPPFGACAHPTPGGALAKAIGLAVEP